MQKDIKLVTFGVKHHSSQDTMPVADSYNDCQIFDDPTGEMYYHNGTEEMLQDYLRSQLTKPKIQTFWEELVSQATKAASDCVFDRMMGVEHDPKTFAMYCFGGRHRSVGVTEILRGHLMALGYKVFVEHQDIHKSGSYASKVRRSKHSGRKIKVDAEI